MTKKEIPSFVIIILPILAIYRIAILGTTISLADFGTLFLAILTFGKMVGKGTGITKIRIKRCRFTLYFITYFFLSIVLLIARELSTIPEMLKFWLHIILITFVVEFAPKSMFDRRYLLKWCILIGTAVSAFLIIQVLLEAIFGIETFPYINSNLIQLNYGRTTTAELFRNQQAIRAIDAYRCSAIFSEPAQFAQYTSLSLVAVVYAGDGLSGDKRRALCASIITLALLLSRSANGVFLCALIWVPYAFRMIKRRVGLRQIVAFITLIIVFVYIVCKTDFFQQAWERVLTMDLRSRGSTGNIRLLQGLAIYEQIPAWAKIIGLGYGNIGGFLRENNITTLFLSDVGNAYMNGFSTVLVSSGIVGLIWYMIIWLQMFLEHKDILNRMAWLTISVLMCTSALFYTPVMFMYLVFIHSETRQTQENGHSLRGYAQQEYSNGRTKAVIRHQEGYVDG